MSEATKMDGTQDKIRSLWVPLRQMNLLLPNVAVAEISSYRAPTHLEGMPEWFLGMVPWRERDIPVISLEAVCGLAVPSNPVFSRLMIVNSVKPDSTLKHFAIVTAGLPGLIQFGNDTADEVVDDAYDGLKCIVRIGSEQAVIPDLPYLQGLLETCLAEAA
ncbi:MAG: chemotaxis protein CheW [Gammaproteobacteria bacterium]